MVYQGQSVLFKTIRLTWTKEKGYTTEEVYHGTFDGVLGLMFDLENRAEQFTVENKGPLWTATAHSSQLGPGGEEQPPVDEVRMTAVRHTKDISQHPMFAGLDADEVKTVVDIFEGRVSQSPATALAQKLLNKMQRKQTFTIEQPIIQRTWTASNRWQFNLAYYTNVGNIFRSSSMVGELAMPGNILGFPLPSDPADVIFDGVTHAYGWKKHYPEYAKSAGSKAVMSQEYEYNLWDLDIDPLAS